MPLADLYNAGVLDMTAIGTSWVTMPRVAIGAAIGVVSWVAAGVAWHLAAGGTVLDSLNLGWAWFKAFLCNQVSVEVDGRFAKFALFTSQGQVVIFENLGGA